MPARLRRACTRLRMDADLLRVDPLHDLRMRAGRGRETQDVSVLDERHGMAPPAIRDLAAGIAGVEMVAPDGPDFLEPRGAFPDFAEGAVAQVSRVAGEDVAGPHLARGRDVGVAVSRGAERTSLARIARRLLRNGARSVAGTI